jgi:hypothetical protein
VIVSQRAHPYKAWPAWYFGPNGQKAVFHRIEDVPVGWKDNPSAVAEPEAPKPENSRDFWEGHSRDDLIHILRRAGERIHAASSTRRLYEKAKSLGLLEEKSADDSREE